MKQNLFNKLWLRVGMIVAIMTTALAASADEITILPSDGTAVESSNYTITKTPISVDVTASTLTSDQMRVFKNQTITISSETATITGITLTCTANGTAKYGPGSLTGTGYTAGTGNTGTWSGSTNSVTLTASNNQARITQIVVTYTPAGGGTPTCAAPTISGDESFLTSTQVSIDCATTGATIQYSTNNGSSWTTYTAPFTLTETTTVQAKATKSDMTDSEVASKTFTKVTALSNIAALTENTEAGNYYVTLSNAVVTFASGNYAYIQDASGAVAVYKSGHGLTAGDVLNGVATVAYQVRNGNPQITDLSGVTSATGTAPEPTEVAASEWNYTFNNVLSQYFKVTGATITQSDSKYYISLGGESVQLYKIGTAISGLDLTKTYTITGFPTLYNTTKELQIFANPEVEVSSDPTITVSTASLSGFTYEAGNGPSDAQSFTVSGAHLTADITLSLGGNDYEMSLTDNGTYTSSLTLNQTSGAVASTTVYVRLKAGLSANSYNDNITISSTDATNVTVSLSGSVTAPAALNVTWNLSIDETATATTTEMTWTSTYATMAVTKGSSSTATNNYYPGTSGKTYTSTRFYSGSNLAITPATGYAIISVVFTATSTNYATALGNSTWTNATASIDGTTVTVTPTNGGNAISATIGGTCGFTEVKVYYETYVAPAAAPVWSTLPTPTNFTGVEYELDLTEYVTGNPAPSISLTSSSAAANDYTFTDGQLSFTPSSAGTYTFSFTATNTEGSANATLTVTAENPEGTPYTLATTITSGKHYIIVNKESSKAMGAQGDNNRAAVDVTVAGQKAFVSSADVFEFVIYGPDASGYYTIYDETNSGYLYAASSGSNHLKTEATLDDNHNGEWKITFGESDNVASIVADRSSNHNVMQYNSSSTLFSCYASASQGSVYLYEKAGEAAPTESVTVSSAGYATFASDNALDFTSSSIKAFFATESAGTLSFTQVTKVPAGTGVLLYANGGATENVPTLSGAADDVTDNVFVRGTGAKVSYDANDQNYILFNGEDGIGFYRANNNTVATNRAYIHVTSGSGNGVKSFAINLEDDATGISLMEDGRSQMEDGVIYNLAGQRISKMQKGINIVNGKKILK